MFTPPFVSRRPFLPRLAAGVVALLLLAVALPGCYSRVVRAEGPGSRNVDVYEANMSEDRIPIIDDVGEALFGK